MLKSSLSPLFICPTSRVLRVLFISLMSCILPWLKVISATGGGPSLLDAGGPPALPRLEAAGPLATIALDSLLTNGSSESTSIMSSRAKPLTFQQLLRRYTFSVGDFFYLFHYGINASSSHLISCICLLSQLIKYCKLSCNLLILFRLIIVIKEISSKLSTFEFFGVFLEEVRYRIFLGIS